MMGATGAGVYGWGTEEEEDVWTVDVNADRQDAEGNPEPADDNEMMVGELTEWRYMCSEREKEQVLRSPFPELSSDAERRRRETSRSRKEIMRTRSNTTMTRIGLSRSCRTISSTSPRRI